jgi:hypothetical protein
MRVWAVLLAGVLFVTTPAGAATESDRWRGLMGDALERNVSLMKKRVRVMCENLGWAWDVSKEACIPALDYEKTCLMMGGKWSGDTCRFSALSTGPVPEMAALMEDLDFSDSGTFISTDTSTPPGNPPSGTCNVHAQVMAEARAAAAAGHPWTEADVARRLNERMDEQIQCNRQIAVYRARARCLLAGQKWVWYKTLKNGIYDGFCMAETAVPLKCCVEQWEAATPQCPPCQGPTYPNAPTALTPPAVNRQTALQTCTIDAINVDHSGYANGVLTIGYSWQTTRAASCDSVIRVDGVAQARRLAGLPPDGNRTEDFSLVLGPGQEDVNFWIDLTCFTPSGGVCTEAFEKSILAPPQCTLVADIFGSGSGQVFYRQGSSYDVVSGGSSARVDFLPGSYIILDLREEEGGAKISNLTLVKRYPTIIDPRTGLPYEEVGLIKLYDPQSFYTTVLDPELATQLPQQILEAMKSNLPSFQFRFAQISTYQAHPLPNVSCCVPWDQQTYPQLCLDVARACGQGLLAPLRYTDFGASYYYYSDPGYPVDQVHRTLDFRALGYLTDWDRSDSAIVTWTISNMRFEGGNAQWCRERYLR